MLFDNQPTLEFRTILWMTAILAAMTFAPIQTQAAHPDDYSTKGISEMLVSKDRTRQAKAQSQLEKLGQAAMPDLIRVYRTGQTEQRIGAILGLSLMPIPELTINGLTEALADPNATVRSLAAHALAAIGTPAAPTVARLLASDSPDVQIGAGFALSKMGTKAVPALTHALKAEDIMVRAKAAWILGRIGPEARPAVPALVQALRADDIRLLHVVAEAIDLIGANPAMLSHELMLPRPLPEGCPFPLKRIGTDAAPVLVALLSRPGTPIAQTALYTLSKVGGGAIPALEKALKDGNRSQRTAAALLLNHMDPTIARTLPPELRETLAGALKNE